MAAEISESVESRPSTQGENPTIELVYDIIGDDDDEVVRDLVVATAPSTYDGLWRQTIKIDPNGAADIWKAAVTYGKRSPPAGSVSAFSMATGGGMSRITQSKQTIANYTASGTPPSFGGAIGVADGAIEGTEIGVPSFDFSFTKGIALATFTLSYAWGLYVQSWTTNNATWKGFAAGEVLFKGMTANQRGDEDYEVTFNFSASPNVTGLAIGSITGIDKKGWEYLWVAYKETTSGTPPVLVKTPVSAHVERVYDASDFTNFGL